MIKERERFSLHFSQLKNLINRREVTFPKLLNLIVLTTVLFSIFIALITVGYQTDHENNRLVPGNIQTMRALSLFMIAWWFVLTVWASKIGVELYKEQQTKRWLAVACSIVPYINLFGLLPIFQAMKPADYGYWFKHLFDRGHNQNSRRSWQYFLMLFVAVMMSPEFAFIFINHYDWNPDQRYGTYLNNLWFYSFQYFTIQTNLFCVIMAWIYVIYPQWKLFDNQTYHTWAISYLFVVALVFDGFLLPNSIRSGATAKWSQYEWARLMWEHAVNPFCFCGSGLFILGFSKTAPRSWKKTVGFGMVIPGVYLFYCLVVPFMTYQTVYSWLSNANPQVINPAGSLLTYGKWFIFWLFASSGIIFFAALSFFWFINQKGYQGFLKRQQNQK